MHDYNLFADIKKLLIESHTKEEIKTLSTSELKKLHGEYLAKGTVEAKSEAEMIKKEIESRGEKKNGEAIEEQFEELHEIEGRRRPYKRPTTTEFLARLKKQKEEEAKKKEEEGEKKKVEENFDRHRPLGSSMGSPGYADRVFAGASRQERLERAAKEREARLEAEKEAKAKTKKKPVAEQNEELLAILDTLCEMAGLDMMNLVELHASGEMTRDDFQNWLHAKGAGAKDKSTEDPRVAAARIKGAKETAKRIGTKSQRAAAAALAGAIKTGKNTAYDIETDAPIEDVHEPTARERAAGAPGAVVDPTKFDRTQGSIEKITNKVSEVEQARQKAANREEMMKRLQPFALGGNKPKGKKKK